MRKSTTAKKVILSLALAAVMAAPSTTGLAQGLTNVSAFDATNTVAYNPMTATKDPFKYAPTFTMQTTKTDGDYWEFIEVKFAAAADFNTDDYLAVQMSVQNYCAFTLGVIENNDRYSTMTAEKPVYFISESGTVTEKAVSGACDVAFPNNDTGMLLVPMSSLTWQWNNNNSDLKGVGSFYLTANSKYIWGYSVTIGNVGVYRGDPSLATTEYETLLDVTTTEKKTAYYCDSQNVDAARFPSEADQPAEVAPAFEYPFRTDDEAFVNGAYWYGPASGDSAVNWQTLSVKFDTATVDMTNAKHLIIEYYAKAGNPGMTFGLNSKGARYATCVDGNSIWGLKAGETTSTKIYSVLYSAVNAGAGFKGAVVIPMENMAWQSGNTTDRSLATIDTLTITTNSQYNWAYEIVVGEVGYISEAGDYVSMLDLAEENSNGKYGKYSISSDLENKGALEYWSAARKMQGDATVDFTAKNRTAESFDVWTGGSYGKAEIVKDSYGDDAVRLTATGSNPTGDAYTAITLAGAGGFSWAGMTGLSCWAKNDSDTEVSFNFEVDCRDKNGVSDRFNIKQGNRFYLYDINTGKTTVYMTRPCATLPVGFEGWIYIPFTAFARADWSTNGVTEFMGEGSMVSYLAITIHAGTYLDKSFSVNKIGAYTKTPSFRSAYVNSGDSMADLLGLNK